MKLKVLALAPITLGLSLGLRGTENPTPLAPDAVRPAPAKTLAAKTSERESGAKSGEARSVSSDPAMKATLKRVTGIGGVFIKAKDPATLRAWYKKHLSIDVQAWGGASFPGGDAAGAPVQGKTAWYVGNGSTFAPSDSSFMINYRVADLTALLTALREEGCQVLDKTERSEFGRFGWVMDPEGNKVELWQPPAGQ